MSSRPTGSDFWIFKYDLGRIRTDFWSVNVDLTPVRADFSQVRADFRPEMGNVRIRGLNLGVGADFRLISD